MEIKSVAVKSLERVFALSLEHEVHLDLQAEVFQHLGFGKLSAELVQYRKSHKILRKHLAKRVLLSKGALVVGNFNVNSLDFSLPVALDNLKKHSINYLATMRKDVQILERDADYVSRALLVKICAQVEDFVGFVSGTFDLIESIGLENYLQSVAS